MTSNEEKEKNRDDCYQSLITWIDKEGGYVNKSLELRNIGDGNDDDINHDNNRIVNRGIFTKNNIKKGEMLISIPHKLVLSGKNMPKTYYKQKDNDNDNKEEKIVVAASSWLRCIGAYYKAMKMTKNNEKEGEKITTENNYGKKSENLNDSFSYYYYKPYLNSLPTKINNDNGKGKAGSSSTSTSSYDSLLNWTNDEIKQYLSGTTLCRSIMNDRQNNILEKRYNDSIRQYLLQNHLSLFSTKEDEDSKDNKEREDNNRKSDEIQIFKDACMCISTRGFHMSTISSSSSNSNNNSTNKDTSSSSDDDHYDGPYLLPMIDLLNHSSPSCCNTSTQSNESSFFMIAERDISSNEEILHSYTGQHDNDTTTSERLLQTFGFVLESSMKNMIDMKSSAQKSHNNMKNTTINLTPATITRNDIINACKIVSQSNYPKSIRQFMDNNKETIHDEYWEIPNNDTTTNSSSQNSNCGTTISNHCRLETLLSSPFSSSSSLETYSSTITNKDKRHDLNNIGNDLIAISYSNPLTDELITLCSLYFIPDEMYDELVLPSSSSLTTATKKEEDHVVIMLPLLDKTILHDYHLGKLVCKALLVLISNKLKSYQRVTSITSDDNIGDDSNSENTTTNDKITNSTNRVNNNDTNEDGTTNNAAVDNDLELMLTLMKSDKSKKSSITTPTTPNIQHMLYGLTIRLEEKQCLNALKNEIFDIISFLDDNDLEQGEDKEENSPRETKRTRLD